MWFIHLADVAGGEPSGRHRLRTSCSRRCGSITGQPALQAAVNTYESAPAKQQTAWTSAYEKGSEQGLGATATARSRCPAGGYGPLPTMMSGLLSFARRAASTERS